MERINTVTGMNTELIFWNNYHSGFPVTFFVDGVYQQQSVRRHKDPALRRSPQVAGHGCLHTKRDGDDAVLPVLYNPTHAIPHTLGGLWRLVDIHSATQA